MPVCQDVDPDIKAMQGIHLYQYFLSNCSQRVCLALEEGAGRFFRWESSVGRAAGWPFAGPTPMAALPFCHTSMSARAFRR